MNQGSKEAEMRLTEGLQTAAPDRFDRITSARSAKSPLRAD
jgi:hypothetical protein